jgi:phosphohistidine phosphatase
MSKELLLVRHGLTEAPGFEKKDINRNLTAPGIHQLERLAKLLNRGGQICNQLVFSPANRCKQTAKLLSEQIKTDHVEMINEIYQADRDTLMNIINGLASETAHAILVGHNPGVSFLAAYLTGEDQLLFSPGMAVRITFLEKEWQQVSKNSGVLEEILQ